MIATSVLSQRRSPRLVVAFAGVQQKLGMGLHAEFHRSLEPLDCAALYVRDTAQRWYQYGAAEIDAVLAQIRAAAAEAGAARLVCIGNSMGGFGALYFGARLKADAILAVAPQTAIDPEVTEGLGDHRWSAFQAAIPAYPFGDLTQLPPATGRVILCRGDADSLDRAHARHLAARWTLEQRVVPDSKHDAAARLRDRGELAPLLRAVIGG